MLDADHLERLISPERFATYVAECSGDRERAVALYHWTGRLSGALTEDLRCLEVVYRNTVHQALTAHHQHLAGRPYGTAWFDEPAWVKHHWWDQPARHALNEARQRAGHRPPTRSRPGAVVAELNFGFWRYVIAARYEQSFWLPALDQRFRGLPGRRPGQRRAHLESRVQVLHKLRNRIAHHEPIFKPTQFLGTGGTPISYTIADQAEMLTEILDWIDPDCANWLRTATTVPTIQAARP